MKAIILAAGKGTRLECEKAELPKALRLVHGKPLIRYVLENISFIPPEDITIVVGFYKEKLMAALGPAYTYVEQETLDGTAHATLCAKDALAGYTGPVMVLYCDMPLLRRSTYERMFAQHAASGADSTLLAGRIHPIPAFGRLVRDAEGNLTEIVEDSACTPEQRLIDEVNVGIQVFNGGDMWDVLAQIDNHNPKREYYLTGAVRVLAQMGKKQHVTYIEDVTESLGVNSMEDMRQAEALLR